MLLNQDGIRRLRAFCDQLQEKCWQIKEKTLIQKGKCEDGKEVQAEYKHKTAQMADNEVRELQLHLEKLKKILNEACVNSYNLQLAQFEVENYMHDIKEESDAVVRQNRLRAAVSALFAFLRVNHSDKGFRVLAKDWLANLVAILLENASVDDHLYLLNHILRCPPDFATWAAGFIQSPDPLSFSDVESVQSILNHCLTVISTILSPIP